MNKKENRRLPEEPPVCCTGIATRLALAGRLAALRGDEVVADVRSDLLGGDEELVRGAFDGDAMRIGEQELVEPERGPSGLETLHFRLAVEAEAVRGFQAAGHADFGCLAVDEHGGSEGNGERGGAGIGFGQGSSPGWLDMEIRRCAPPLGNASQNDEIDR